MKRFLLLILILLVPSVAFGISGNAVNIGGGSSGGADGLPNITSATVKTWDLSSFEITLPPYTFDMDNIADGENYQRVAASDVDAGGHVISVASGATNVVSTRDGSLGTPSTTTPLSPAWTSPMHVIYVGGTQTINLPAAAGYDGRGFALKFRGSYVATVDPNASEIMYRDGTAQTGGVSVTVTGTAGQMCSFMSDGTSWASWGCTATMAQGS